MVEGAGMDKVHVQVQRPRQLTLMSAPFYFFIFFIFALCFKLKVYEFS